MKANKQASARTPFNDTKIATVGKSYSALDLQDDIVVCCNGGAKVYKLLET